MERIVNNNQNGVISKKLGVADYVFEYKGIDLNNARVEYMLDKIKQVDYEKDKRDEESSNPYIDFSISADDKNKKTYSFDFMINMDIDMLNKMTEKPTNINEYIVQGELFFYNPYIEEIEFWDFYLEENIYNYQPNFSVSKVADNKFVFRIQYQNLFTFFLIDFNQ